MNSLAQTIHQQASFTLRTRNPDVLTGFTNRSNDEVLTPADLTNRMSDVLAEAWAPVLRCVHWTG